MRIPSLQTTVRHTSIAVAMVLLAAAASAQTSGAATANGQAGNTTGTVATGTPNAGTGMGGGARASHADAGFMKKAAQNNVTEIEASKLALTKASSADVKAYAQQMIDDHTKTGEEMKTLASAKGVELPDSPSLMQTAKIKALGAMSGTNFDKRYATIVGVNAHQATVKLFQKESAAGKDPEVKAFATKTLPALQHHLEMAETLKSATAHKA